MKEGIIRTHTDGKSVSWKVLRGIEGIAKGLDVVERMTWIGLALSYLLLLKEHEFIVEDGRVHAVYCLRGENTAFCAGEWKMGGRNSLEMDTVEVRLRCLKDDQNENRERWG